VVRATGPTEYEILDPKDDPKDDKSYQMRLILINGELFADVSSKNAAGNGFGTRALGPAARAGI